MAEKTKQPAIGEYFLDFFSRRHNLQSAKVRNTSGGNSTVDTDWRLLPVKLNGAIWEFSSAAEVTTGGAGNVDGFIVNYAKELLPVLANNAYTEYECVIIERGPFTIHDDFIPTVDIVAASIVKADYVTELKRLGGINRDTEGTTEEQTT